MPERGSSDNAIGQAFIELGYDDTKLVTGAPQVGAVVTKALAPVSDIQLRATDTKLVPQLRQVAMTGGLATDKMWQLYRASYMVQSLAAGGPMSMRTVSAMMFAPEIVGGSLGRALMSATPYVLAGLAGWQLGKAISRLLWKDAIADTKRAMIDVAANVQLAASNMHERMSAVANPKGRKFMGLTEQLFSMDRQMLDAQEALAVAKAESIGQNVYDVKRTWAAKAIALTEQETSIQMKLIDDTMGTLKRDFAASISSMQMQGGRIENTLRQTEGAPDDKSMKQREQALKDQATLRENMKRVREDYDQSLTDLQLKRDQTLQRPVIERMQKEAALAGMEKTPAAPAQLAAGAASIWEKAQSNTTVQVKEQRITNDLLKDACENLRRMADAAGTYPLGVFGATT
jgi:hypothetical protein